MRLLSAEARIPLHHMRNGKMSDDDWNKLVRKMGEVSRLRCSSTTRRT